MRAPNLRPRTWDLTLVFTLFVIGAGQLLVGEPSAPVWTVVRISSLFALIERRRYPVAMICVGYTLSSLGALGQYAQVGLASPPDVTAALLLLPYALGRRTSGRRWLLGVGLAAVTVTPSFVAEGLNPAEMAGAAVILSIPLALGTSNRLREGIRQQALLRAQLDERNRLAQQLDEVVAHRLAAILDRAELELGPEGTAPSALTALEDIERQASQCLDEMRELVRELREGEDRRSPHASRPPRSAN